MWKFLAKMAFAVVAAVLVTRHFPDVSDPGHVNCPKAGSDVFDMDMVRSLARDSRMAAVVEGLTNRLPTAEEPRALRLRLNGAIDGSTSSEIRHAFTTNAEGHGEGDELSKFFTTEDPAATCSTAKTAGVYGLEVCSARCAATGTFWKKAPDGSCYLLCSLAVAPCGYRPFNRAVFYKTGINNTAQALSIGGARVQKLCLSVIPMAVAVYALIAWQVAVYLAEAAHQSSLWGPVIDATIDLLQDDVQVMFCVGLLGLVVMLAIMRHNNAQARRHLLEREEGMAQQLEAAPNSPDCS